MKNAADFRIIARSALAGKWGLAVGAGFIASLLGGVAGNGVEFNLGNTDSGFQIKLGDMQELLKLNWNASFLGALLGGAIILILFALAVAIAFFFLGSIIRLGYAKFNLDLVDRQNKPEVRTLFGYFTHWKTAAATAFLKGFYILLWSLLFIIPGIIATYSYAMTSYILAEHPELTASEAIERSRQMMSGNRFRLFCLQISFIG